MKTQLRRDIEGYSLVELAVIIIVLMILAIASYNALWGSGTQDRARQQACMETINKMYESTTLWLRETGKTDYTGLKLSDLVSRGYLPPGIEDGDVNPWQGGYTLKGEDSSITITVAKVPADSGEAMKKALRLRAREITYDAASLLLTVKF